ncbi:hypothetical protein BKA70DRAFT_1430375 [Coprinopsis sp. MPI-PUGE-AT-0042]|nr:hypothetical protein BKA70DRAFT_1430375 [Coprinopsis sp. MPI-PUGE-AT-0042]
MSFSPSLLLTCGIPKASIFMLSSRLIFGTTHSRQVSIPYFLDFGLPDSLPVMVTLNVLIWYGDALIIYKCYLIWHKSVQVIILPAFLLICGIVVNSTAMGFLKVLQANPSHPLRPVLYAVFPINLLLNCLTTGLIAYQICRQHLRAQKAGLTLFVGSPRHNLLTIARIIVESAFLYTGQLLILLVLWAIDHPGHIILYGTLTPTVSIVFFAIAICTHLGDDEVSLVGDPPAESDIEMAPQGRGSQSEMADESDASEKPTDASHTIYSIARSALTCVNKQGEHE